MGEGVVTPVAALFVRADSIYKTMPGVDCWDIDRDARLWPGGCPVVAHPPCSAWGAFAMFAKPREGERELAVWAIVQIRACGGVLEHPAASKLWPEMSLPKPGRIDQYGGFTLPVHQSWWGHKAQKKTLLYVVGVRPDGIPVMPLDLSYPTHVIGDVGRASDRSNRPEIPKSDREKTPPAFAQWLVELARSCKHEK